MPAPAGSHPDFFVSAQRPSRAASSTRTRRPRSTPTPATAAATAPTSPRSPGYNGNTGATVEDAQGFNYGLGIAPVRRASARPRSSTAPASFDVTTSITALHSRGLRERRAHLEQLVGRDRRRRVQLDARRSSTGSCATRSRAWPATRGSSRSSRPATRAPGANTIGSPGTAKNVITVGASENVRAIGATDGCGVTDAGANSARDVIDFSEPRADRRRAHQARHRRARHARGRRAAADRADYNGSGICNPQFPAGQLAYTLVSGTSQATPGGRPASPRCCASGTRRTSAADAASEPGDDEGADGQHGHRPGRRRRRRRRHQRDLPTQVQGWGRINLGTVLDGTTRQVRRPEDGVQGARATARPLLLRRRQPRRSRCGSRSPGRTPSGPTDRQLVRQRPRPRGHGRRRDLQGQRARGRRARSPAAPPTRATTSRTSSCRRASAGRSRCA